MSDNFNHFFRKADGYSATWGKNKEDDPAFSPYGPLIADIEITTICHGPNGVPCSFCYKANTPNGHNMTLETFKKVLDKLPRTVGQIAFGIDATATANPEIWDIFQHTRDNWIVPNLTVAQVSDEVADKISSLAGACAVSLYADKNICYDSVKKLTDRGMTQVNIHWCYHSGNIDRIHEIISDIKTDPRLAKLNAVVLLALKQKGRGTKYNPVDFPRFKSIVENLLINEIKFGFDSCSARNFLRAVEGHPKEAMFKTVAEPCESTCFSSYIDVHGKFYPCSFCEKIKGWEEGLDVVNCKDFLTDIWGNDKTIAFRENLLKCGRSCPVYKI
jgi:hypothetical protein